MRLGQAFQLNACGLHLIYERCATCSPDLLEDLICCLPPLLALALCCDKKGVHQGLRMVPPNLDEQLVDEIPHNRVVGVDPGNHLGHHNQPGVNRNKLESLNERCLHLLG